MARATSSTALESISWDQAFAWRLHRHHLVRRAPRAKLLDVVGDICGLHAQVLSSAELSLWARVDGLERTTVLDLLWKRRALVKLWAMRGTLHLLPSRELGLWLSAMSTRQGLDALTEAVARALDGRMLTREELAQEVAQDTGSEEYAQFVRFSWGSYLKAASYRGLICFAPSDGNNVRFTSPATWVRGRIDRIDSQEAFRELIRRFLRAYGPATAEFLALWSGHSLRIVRKRLAELADETVQLDVEGLRGWILARDRRSLMAATQPNVVRLLPAFDPWVVGASRVEGLLDPSHKPFIYRPQGWISPVVLVDGRIAGLWKHTSKGRRLVVEVKPFGRLPAWAAEEIESEAERLAAFLGGALELDVA
jgi:uncharacterized protein YcaQ